MRHVLAPAFLGAALIPASVVGVPAPRHGVEAPPQPKVIWKDKGYLVHAVPKLGFGGRLGPAEPGLLILHTSLPSGKMRILARTGGWTDRSPHAATATFGRTRLVGLAEQGGYAFMLLHGVSGRLRGPVSEEHCYLKVVRLTTGEPIRQVRLVKAERAAVRDTVAVAKLPPANAKETTEPGLLRSNGNGVTCLGVRFTVKDGKLTWTAAP